MKAHFPPRRSCGAFTLSCSLIALAALSAAPLRAQAALEPAPAANPASGQGTASAPAEQEGARASESGDNAAEQERLTNEILVIGKRLIGEIETDYPPIAELNEDDILAYGSESLADLVQQLAVETGSSRGRGGRPVILVNGQRIASFREFRRYPPEAVRKVEILPEEVALRYGYRPDQRVINIILKDNFKSYQADIEYGWLSEGGRRNVEFEPSMVQLDGPRKLNLAGEYQTSSMLTESERNVIQPAANASSVPSDPDPAAYRSLLPQSEELELTASWSTGLGQDGRDGNWSLSGTYAREESLSWFGLERVSLTGPGGETALRVLDNKPLTQRETESTVSLASALNFALGDWQLENTIDISRAHSDERTDAARNTSLLQQQALAGVFPVDGQLPIVVRTAATRALSTSYALAAKSTLRGTALELPAGDVVVTLDGALGWSRITSLENGPDEDTSGAGAGQSEADERTRLARRTLTLSSALAIPLTSRRNQVLPQLGDIALNLRGGVSKHSDFGALADLTTGLSWSPVEPLTLDATYIARDVAPGLSQLGAPPQRRFNVPVYDFRTGQSVQITTISGGNAALKPERQRDLKLSASFDLGIADHSRLQLAYNRNRSYDVTSAFPPLTSAVEAAFPSRITRSDNGALLSLDRRPITFAETRQKSLTVGLTLFGRIKESGKGGKGGRGSGGGRSSMGQNASGGAARAGNAPQSGDLMARLAKARADFCASAPGTVPDLSGLPPMIRERLSDANGEIDPDKIKMLRQRFCGDEAAKPPGAKDNAAQPPGGAPWAAGFAKLRAALCSEDKSSPPDLSALPAPLIERLKGENGEIDPAKLAKLRARLCSSAAVGAGGGFGGGGGAGARPGRGGAMPGFGRRGGRWMLSANYTHMLESKTLIAPGAPVLDALAGDSLAATGTPRNLFTLNAGRFKDGIGTRVSLNYTGPAMVRGSGLPGSQDLRFSSLTTVNLRAFIDLGEMRFLTGDQPGFWKGARLSLRVNNLFDQRRKVTNEAGAVPLRYQPYYLDPTGRRLSVEFRKMF